MFSKFSTSVKTIILTLLIGIIGFFTYASVNQSNLSASVDGIQKLLRKVNVNSQDQDVGLPKVDKERYAEEKTNHLLYTFIEILLTLAGIMAVVFIAIGGMEYTVSAGNDDRLNGAKAKIMYAVLGLLAVLFSYAIFTNGINFFEVSEQ
ncbi:TPA: hypothetical protein EYG84_03210 [Candidatus Gracilibacteria bacterium]|nr:hypothetical protein [Candidatus Gracilibacteria bacterium]